MTFGIQLHDRVLQHQMTIATAILQVLLRMAPTRSLVQANNIRMQLRYLRSLLRAQPRASATMTILKIELKVCVQRYNI
jgi:hypothetical protein